MTGDEIDPKTMMYANESDIEVALRIRMLYRDQLDHEAVCTGARDRIMYLSQEVNRLKIAGKEVIDGADSPHKFCSGQVFVDVGSLDALRAAVSSSPKPEPWCPTCKSKHSQDCDVHHHLMGDGHCTCYSDTADSSQASCFWPKGCANGERCSKAGMCIARWQNANKGLFEAAPENTQSDYKSGYPNDDS